MRTSLRGVHLIESFEGFVPYVYDDATNLPWGSGPGHSDQGTATVGYGTTSADINPLPSHLTEAQAERLLIEKLHEKYEPAVNAVNPPNQNAYDALVSFSYNLGTGSMQWDVGRYVKAGNLQAAAQAMLQYDHAGGQMLPGLQRRRQEEARLLLEPAPRQVDYSVFVAGKERSTVQEWDRLYPHRHLHLWTLHKLRKEMVGLRKAVWVAAHPKGHPVDWQSHARGTRWQLLNHRIDLPL